MLSARGTKLTAVLKKHRRNDRQLGEDSLARPPRTSEDISDESPEERTFGNLDPLTSRLLSQLLTDPAGSGMMIFVNVRRID